MNKMANKKMKAPAALQLLVLNYIKAHPNSTYKEIAKALGRNSVGNVAAAVRGLAAKGYMEAKKGPGRWVLKEEEKPAEKTIEITVGK